MPKLIVIGGPTASGKTTLAIELAVKLNTEIISADSRQCFKELSIGTAKPSPQELKKVKHHFIDLYSISENVNAGIFTLFSETLLNTTLKNNPYVIITGGTGLYIKSLLSGLDDLPPIPSELRTAIKEEFSLVGLNPFLKELEQFDFNYFEKIDKSNHARVLRAIEIIRQTGKPYSSFIGHKKSKNPYTSFCFTTNLNRNELYKKIDLRVDVMMQLGLLEEVKSVIDFQENPALKTVGYSELFDFIEGKTDLPMAINLIKQHSRNYAKRQVTWFRNQGEFTPIHGNSIDDQVAFILSTINDIEKAY